MPSMGNHKRKTKPYFVAPRKYVCGPRLPEYTREAKCQSCDKLRTFDQWLFRIAAISTILTLIATIWMLFNEHRRDPGVTINVTVVTTNQIIINHPQKFSRPQGR